MPLKWLYLLVRVNLFIILLILPLIKSFPTSVQDASVCGIFHWSGNVCMTKFDMAVAIGAAFGLPVDHLRPDNSQPSGDVRRPHDTQLACKRLEALGIGRRTAFRDGIIECLKPFM